MTDTQPVWTRTRFSVFVGDYRTSLVFPSKQDQFFGAFLSGLVKSRSAEDRSAVSIRWFSHHVTTSFRREVVTRKTFTDRILAPVASLAAKPK